MQRIFCRKIEQETLAQKNEIYFYLKQAGQPLTLSPRPLSLSTLCKLVSGRNFPVEIILIHLLKLTTASAS